LALLLLIDEGLDVIGKGLKPNKRPVSLILLLDDVGVLEVVLELGSALDAGVAHLADLVRVKLLPGLVVELAVEVLDELGVDEVEKGVAHIAVVLRRPGGTL
jgi:hypothetical protein